MLARDPLWKIGPVAAVGGDVSRTARRCATSRVVRSTPSATGTRALVPGAVWLACSHADVIKSIVADALGLHLDQFQRIAIGAGLADGDPLRAAGPHRPAGERRRRHGRRPPAAEARARRPRAATDAAGATPADEIVTGVLGTAIAASETGAGPRDRRSLRGPAGDRRDRRPCRAAGQARPTPSPSSLVGLAVADRRAGGRGRDLAGARARGAAAGPRLRGAYQIDVRELRRSFGWVVVLAAPGVVVSAAIVAIVLHVAAGLPLDVAFVVGAIVSATDPVAVVAIFRRLRSPARSATLVEAESLFNDGTAIVVFVIALARHRRRPMTPVDAVVAFVATVAHQRRDRRARRADGVFGDLARGRPPDRAHDLACVLAYGTYLSPTGSRNRASSRRSSRA